MEPVIAAWLQQLEGNSLKVLHIITCLDNGGAEAVLFRLIGCDDSDSHQVISLTEMGHYGPQLVAEGVPVDTLEWPRGRVTLGGLRKLYRLIREAKPDVVQTWMYHADLIGGIAVRLARSAPVVWGLHHTTLSPEETSRSTRAVGRLCALLSDWLPRSVISCSESGAALHVHLGYSPDKMRVVHNGYDLDVFSPDSAASARLRSEWGVNSDNVLFGMVARWDPQKDHANLIAAMAELKHHRTNTPFRCVLVGNGLSADNAALADVLDAYDLRQDVLLLGPRDDIPAVMSALDVHVLSSAFGEAFPNVVAEAMACETPVVVTDVGDAAVIVGECGWVSPPSDPVQLAEALSKAVDAMKDNESWDARRLACRERVLQRFDLRKMVSGYRAAWQDLPAPTGRDATL